MGGGYTIFGGEVHSFLCGDLKLKLHLEDVGGNVSVGFGFVLSD
jgi:hypothetical protein